jgi:hypothetical protein
MLELFYTQTFRVTFRELLHHFPCTEHLTRTLSVHDRGSSILLYRNGLRNRCALEKRHPGSAANLSNEISKLCWESKALEAGIMR